MAFEAIDGGLGIPEQPDWGLLFSSAQECATAAGYWSKIVTEMRAAETISGANGHAIERLVTAQVVYDRASAAVASQGAVRRIKGVERKNPNWIIARQSSELCSSLEAELGLSPAKRSRVAKVARRARRPAAADEFLRPVR
jgi:P27 family predicted phage terminase small subunit